MYAVRAGIEAPDDAADCAALPGSIRPFENQYRGQVTFEGHVPQFAQSRL